MKIVPALAAVSVAALASGALLPLAVPATADVAPGPGPTLRVTDPAGDVLDPDGTTPARARATDVTRAVYRVVADRDTPRDTTDRLVSFAVEHRRSLFGQRGPQQRLTVTFTSGERRYRATSGPGSSLGLTYVDADGERREAGSSFGASFGGGRTTVEFPADAVGSGPLSDIRSTLRVVGSRTRDVVAAPDAVLDLERRR